MEVRSSDSMLDAFLRASISLLSSCSHNGSLLSRMRQHSATCLAYQALLHRKGLSLHDSQCLLEHRILIVHIRNGLQHSRQLVIQTES